MSKVALVAALALLLFFAYLTGAHPGFNLAYALCLLVAIAWLWPLAEAGQREVPADV